jgi:hypothetical protein
MTTGPERGAEEGWDISDLLDHADATKVGDDREPDERPELLAGIDTVFVEDATRSFTRSGSAGRSTMQHGSSSRVTTAYGQVDCKARHGSPLASTRTRPPRERSPSRWSRGNGRVRDVR